MDDRATQGSPVDLPIQRQVGEPPSSAGPLGDPRALTILTTEHWSLLSARSLVYNEAFARGAMFLTFLSATLVALGLVSTATRFSSDFLIITAAVLGVDLFIGLATLGRIETSLEEDLRCMQGMNRLRHAYHETVPGLERYFVSSSHDDIRGIIGVYGVRIEDVMAQPNILHHFTTMPGMIGVICAAVGATLGGVILLLVTDSTAIAGVGALAILVLGVVTSLVVVSRRIGRFTASIEAVFPSPDPPGAGGWPDPRPGPGRNA